VERDPFVTKGLRAFDLWTLSEGSIGLTLTCSDRTIALA